MAERTLIEALGTLPEYSGEDEEFIRKDVTDILKSGNEQWLSSLVSGVSRLPEYQGEDSAFVVNNMSNVFGVKKGPVQKALDFFMRKPENEELAADDAVEPIPPEPPSLPELTLPMEQAGVGSPEPPPPPPQPEPEPGIPLTREEVAALPESVKLESAIDSGQFKAKEEKPVEVRGLRKPKPDVSFEERQAPIPTGERQEFLVPDVAAKITKYQKGEDHPSFTKIGRAFERVNSWFPQAAAVFTREMANGKELDYLEEDTERIQRGSELYEKHVKPLHAPDEISQILPSDQPEVDGMTDTQKALVAVAFDPDRQWLGNRIPVLTEEEKALKPVEREDLTAFLLEVGKIRSNVIAERWDWAKAGALERVEKLDPRWMAEGRVAEAIANIETSESMFARAWRTGDVATMVDHLGLRALVEGTPEAERNALRLRGQLNEAITQESEAAKRSKFEETLFSAIEMLPTMGKGMAVGAIPGIGSALSQSYWAAQGAGGVYLDLIEAGVPREFAASAAVNAGLLYAAVEQQKAGQLLQAGGKGIASKMLKNTVVKKVVSSFMDKTIDYGMEVGEEVFQELVLEAGKDFAKTRAGMDIGLGPDDRTWQDKYWRIAKETAAQTAGPLGLVQAGFMAGGRASRTAGQRLSEAEASERLLEAQAQPLDQGPPIRPTEAAEEAQDQGEARGPQQPAGETQPPGTQEQPQQGQELPEGDIEVNPPAIKPQDLSARQTNELVRETEQEIRQIESKTEPSEPTTDTIEAVTEAQLERMDEAEAALEDDGYVEAEPVSAAEVWDRSARPRRTVREDGYKTEGFRKRVIRVVDRLISLTRDGVMVDDKGVGLQGRKAFDSGISESFRRRDQLGEFNVATGDVTNLGGINKAIGHIGADYVLKKLGQIMRKHLAPLNGNPFRTGGDEVGAGAHGNPEQFSQAINAIENEFSQWIDSKTVGDIAKEANVPLKKGVDPSLRMADLPHPKHDGMPTGGGYVTFATNNSSGFTNAHDIITDADARLDIRSLERLKEKARNLVDENGDEIYIEDRDSNNQPVFRRRSDGKSAREEAGPAQKADDLQGEDQAPDRDRTQQRDEGAGAEAPGGLGQTEAFGEEVAAPSSTPPPGMSQEEWDSLSNDEKLEIEEALLEEEEESLTPEEEEISEAQNDLITGLLKKLRQPPSRITRNRKTGEVNLSQLGGFGLAGPDWENVRNFGRFEDLTEKGKNALQELHGSINSSQESREPFVEAGLHDSASEEISMDQLREWLSKGATTTERAKGSRGFFAEEKPRQQAKQGESRAPKPNIKEAKQTANEKETAETLSALDLTGIEGLNTDQQRQIQEDLRYSMGAYAEGSKKPGLVQLPELIELVKFLQGAPPKLLDSIARKFTIAGAFNPKSRKIVARRDIWIGPLIAEITGNASRINRIQDEIINELVTEGIDPDDIVIKRQSVRGGRAIRLRVYRRDESYAPKIIAHELGHFIDLVDENPELETMARGNILGRIASLAKHLKSTLPGFPGAKGEISASEKAAIKEAAKQILGEGSEKLVDEEIKQVLGVSPDVVVGILGNSTEDMRKNHPDLYEYIARLDRAEKKRILVLALRDKVVADELKKFGKEVKRKTGRKIKIKVPVTAQELQEKYNKLIRDEIARRQLVEKSVVQEELQDLTRAWRPFDPSHDPAYTKYRYSSEELYADAISVLLNDPDLLIDKAPVFYKTFFYYAPKKGKVAQLWLEIQKDLEKKNLLNRRARNLREVMVDRVEAILSKQEAMRAETQVNWRTVWNAIGLVLWDKNFQAIRKKMRAMRNGLIVEPENDPQLAMQKYGRVTTKQTAYMYKVADWLRRLQKDGITIEDMHEIAFEERIMHDRERQDIANPLGYTPTIAADQWNDLKRRLGDDKFKKAQEYLHEFRINRRQVVEQWADSGMLSSKARDYVLKNDAYATFNVVDELKARYGNASPIVTLRRQIGTLSDIENVISATVAKDLSIIRATERSNAWNSWKSFVKSAVANGTLGLEDDVVEADNYLDLPPQGMGKIMIEENGRLKAYFVPEYLERSFNEDTSTARVITTFLYPFSLLNRVIKGAYVTKNLGFAVANLVRDYRRTAIFAPGNNMPLQHWFTLMPRYLESISPVMKTVFGNIPDQTVMEMMERGELYTVTSPTTASENTRHLERLLAKYKLSGELDKKVFNPISKTLDTIGMINEATELLGKVAARKYLDKYASEWSEEKKQDYVAGKLGSPDYSRSTLQRNVIGNIALFYNPQKEAIRSNLEVLKERPVETTWKLIKSSVVPTIFTYLLAKGVFKEFLDPDDEDDKEALKWLTFLQRAFLSAGSYDLHNYGIIPLSSNRDGSINLFRMPLDETERAVRGLVWAGLEAADGKFDPSYLYDIVNFMGDQIPSTAPAVQLPVDFFKLASGENIYDSWYDRFAIPKNLEKGDFLEVRMPIALRYLWNKYGGKTIVNSRWGQDNPPRNALEQLTGIPVAGPIVNRFFRTVEPYEGEAQRAFDRVLRPAERWVHTERFRRFNKLRDLLEESGYATEPDLAAKAYEETWGAWDDPESPPPVSIEQYLNTWKALNVKKFGTVWERVMLSASYKGKDVQRQTLKAIHDIRKGEEEAKKDAGMPYLTPRQITREIDAMRTKIGLYGELVSGERGEGVR